MRGNGEAPVQWQECGPEALDCSPRRMIAVSGAVNVVLSRAIEADNVVSETR